MLDSKNVQIELINKLNTPNTNRVFGNYSAYVEYEYDNVNLKGNYVQKYHSKNRKITSNRPDVQLPDNSIQTSKYTLINFFPKQLYEQFSKLANIYFVIIGALQMVPEVSISQGFPTIYLPLSFIIFISGAKDFYEDYKRRKSDLDENYRLVRALEGDTFQSIQSEKLRVGQIIRVNQDEIIPADILVLRSSEPKGICYVETKSLDGETNLKQKNVHIDLIKSFDSDDSFHLEEKKIILKYQAPNPYLYKFMGEITTSEGRISSINFNNFLLRGCAVRNVRYIYGLVSYTGHDTKIMMNSFKARSKRSKLEGLMQKLTLYIFIIQIILCLFAALVYSIYYQSNREQLRYLDIDNLVSEYNFTYNLFVRFGNWILIFTNFVPISLLVTLEMVKFIQGKLMSIDPKLNEPSVQSSNLNEELGQIEHIFSDKTGTLTCNIMEFKQIIIGNQNYGDISKDSMNYITESELDQYPSVTNVNFRDKRIFEAMEDSGHIMHAKVKDCLIMLSTCHTVITDTKDGKTIFNATSPDELALLSFAKFVGYEFAGIDENNIMRIKHDDQIDEYEAVEVFEFTSTRKRQSVLIKSLKTNEIILYTKGADSVLLDPLRLSREELEQKQDFNNLNSMLQEYGKIGLRTLVLCKRMIKEDEFRVWHKEYLEAASCLENREEKMQTLQDKLEKNFNIIGATAIEDKLQADVASTIACIKQAGIKVWVLTGDKIETAINIGFSCQLLSSELTQHIVDEKEESMVRARLDEIISSINPSDDNHALIISGDALLHALKPDIQNKVMQIGDLCKVVLCCRVSPKQKQDVVSLVRNVKPTCSTLAIGDGANDVNMITAAHVGIGIRGVEGQQAARAADYAVEEFRELRRLLFYHGRECYRRNSVLVCYTFYKNTLLVLPQFWYGILSMYSAQSLYDTFIYQLFNVFYGALPIVVYGVFDEEYDADELTKNKTNYYKQGPQGLLFNHRIFWFWLFTGVWQAALLCFFATFSVSDGFVDNDGYTQHLWAQGTMIFGLVVVVCNLKVMIFSNSYSPAFLLSIFFSLTSYLLSWIVLDNIPSAEAYVVLESLFQTPNFHLGNILVIGACCGIDIAMNLKFSRALMKPQLPPQTIPQTSVIYGAIPQASFNPHLNRNVGKLTTKVQPYSGFAFNCLDREQIDEAKEEQKLYGNI